MEKIAMHNPTNALEYNWINRNHLSKHIYTSLIHVVVLHLAITFDNQNSFNEFSKGKKKKHKKKKKTERNQNL